VALREKLRWFEDKPLFGRTVVVTRSREQASALTERLEELGAEALEFPTIQVVEPEDWRPVDEVVRRVGDYDWIVFTSVNGVEAFFDRLEQVDLDARALARAQVAAIGPATAARCIDRGVRPDYVPEEYRAEGVLEGFLERGVGAGTKVLLPRALEAREVLPETLRERGATVDVVAVYRTVLGSGGGSVLERLSEGEVDVVTFTSSSTVRNFVELAKGGGLDLAAAMKDVLVASIGPITSDTCRELGLTVGVEADEFTIPGLVQAVLEALGAAEGPDGHIEVD
jgi:uroporphyrinogen III methyltransferase/synthase